MSDMVDVRRLKAEIGDLEHKLTAARSKVADIQRRCQHQWEKPVYDPIVRGGYHDPGDPVGTMGIDRRLPMYVPREEKPRWSRHCLLCDLTETTEQATDSVTKIPKF